jgi:TonB family protein
MSAAAVQSSPVASASLTVASAVLHVSLFFLLGVLPTRVEPTVRTPQEVAFEVEEPPPAPEPEVPPAPEPEVVRAPPVAQTAAPRTPAEPTPPAPVAAAPVPEVVDFSNINLTNDNSNSDFAISRGTGQAADGPMRNVGVGRLSDRNVAGRPDGVEGGTGTGPSTAPAVVPAASLSRATRPPSSISAVLERNYPREAREQEIEGETLVKLIIRSDGTPSNVRVLRGGDNGFGAACRRTLLEGGRWVPPLGANGEAVATEVEFTCSFEVRR